MIQQVNTTHEEKVKMYMKCSKKELAEMLVLRDELLIDERDGVTQTITTGGTFIIDRTIPKIFPE